MSKVHSSASFDDPLQQRIYEYVERHGAVTESELMRSIRLAANDSQSKPARSGTYTHDVVPSPAAIRSGVEALREEGYLTESGGHLRLALSATPRDVEVESGAITLRPAREADRRGILETMRTVARDGSYVVAENVAERLERDTAVVRVDGDRSRICFVASDEPDATAPEAGTEAGEPADAEDGERTGTAGEHADETDADGRAADDERVGDETSDGIVGWFQLDAPVHDSRAHTAEVTVGVDPDARGRGIGTALLEYGCEWAGDQDYHKLTQGVPATNEDAIAFLENAGWEHEGERRDQYRIDGAYVDQVLFATFP